MAKVYVALSRFGSQAFGTGWLMGMRSSRLIGAAAALAVALTFVVASVPASAVDRAEGAYWTYDVIMDIEGFDVTGEATYTVEGEDTLVVGGEEYDVTVLRMLGDMTGSMSMSGFDVTFNIAMDGFTYEKSGYLATVKEDLNLFMNMTTDALGYEFTIRTQTQMVTTYDPPLLSGFNDESGTGDSWDEEVTVTMTTEMWQNDTLYDDSTDDMEMTYSVEIAATLDDIDVDGTIYPCMKITITDQDGNYEMRWYNADIGYYAQVKEYESGASAPLATMKLTDFSTKSSSSSMLLLAGIGVAVAVVALVAILLLMKKRKPAPMPPAQPVQPGYYAAPPQGPPPPPAPPPGQ